MVNLAALRAAVFFAVCENLRGVDTRHPAVRGLINHEQRSQMLCFTVCLCSFFRLASTPAWLRHSKAIITQDLATISVSFLICTWAWRSDNWQDIQPDLTAGVIW